MQTFELLVKFTTNFLGSGKRANGVRKLVKTREGYIEIPHTDLQKELKGRTTIDNWRLRDIEAARVNILRRVYNRVRVDRFEGVEKGTQVSMILEVGDVTDFKNIKELVLNLGRSGISQWGRKFNCGKFKLIDITRINS
jgi:hypothetical protein